MTKKSPKDDDKQARLAQALRANLRRRKQKRSAEPDKDRKDA